MTTHGSLSSVRCANCGRCGHVYKVCNYPISSFGVICFRKRTWVSPIEYLMVQRNDSLCYVEFVRGKYMIQNRAYILKLLANMTNDERDRLRTGPFEALWFGFWQTTHTHGFVKEFHQASELYNTLRNGYWLRSMDIYGTTILRYFDLVTALHETCSGYSEPEWGFPKGRRNINESDLSCAKREFLEETSLSSSSIFICPRMRPVEEVFIGTNKVNYRHVYYLAAHCAPKSKNVFYKAMVDLYPNPKTIPRRKSTPRRRRCGKLKENEQRCGKLKENEEKGKKMIRVNPIYRNASIVFRIRLVRRLFFSKHIVRNIKTSRKGIREREIQSVRWFNYNDVVKRIRQENSARLHMFDRVHDMLMQIQP